MNRWCGPLVVLAILSTIAISNIAVGQGSQPRKKAEVGGPSPDYKDVKYGPAPENALDIWLAKSGEPTAIIVNIHGGGGDKSQGGGPKVKKFLDAGVSYTSINYRTRKQVPIQDSLRDCARAIQFLRLKAKEWNLDTNRIGAKGYSAGGTASLWIAVHDDLADPNSQDPVLRESSRISVIAVDGCAATKDVVKAQEILEAKPEVFYPQSSWPGYYGLKTLEEVLGPVGQKIRADCDMLAMISKDDPPMYLSTEAFHPENAPPDEQIGHHPYSSIAVKEQCDRVGVEAVLHLSEASKKYLVDHGKAIPDNTPDDSLNDFLFKILGAKPAIEIRPIP